MGVLATARARFTKRFNFYAGAQRLTIDIFLTDNLDPASAF
jgi:hypothetical protein